MQYLTKISTSPVEPVSIADMLLWLKQDTGPDDLLIESLITAARIHAEGFQRSSLTAEHWQLKLEHFPYFTLRDQELLVYEQMPEWEGFWNLPGGLLYPTARRFAIELPRNPLVSIDSFTYLDTTSTQQTLISPDNYQVETADDAAPLIYPADGTYWPVTAVDPAAITIQFTAGFTAANIPANTLTAIKILVAAMYGDREGKNPLPPFAMTLLRLDRSFEF